MQITVYGSGSTEKDVSKVLHLKHTAAAGGAATNVVLVAVLDVSGSMHSYLDDLLTVCRVIASCVSKKPTYVLYSDGVKKIEDQDITASDLRWGGGNTNLWLGSVKDVCSSRKH